MRPRREDGDSCLQVITAEGQTISELEELTKTSPYYGFPVVVSRQCMRLVGYVTSQELQDCFQNDIIFRSFVENHTDGWPL